jgi:hypothetical protein
VSVLQVTKEMELQRLFKTQAQENVIVPASAHAPLHRQSVRVGGWSGAAGSSTTSYYDGAAGGGE